MRLHNYLVDYREENNCYIDAIVEKDTFEVASDDNEVNSMVLGNNVCNSAGIPSLHEKDERVNRLKIRDKLRQSLLDHEMRRPRKSEWNMDKYMHVNRI